MGWVVEIAWRGTLGPHQIADGRLWARIPELLSQPHIRMPGFGSGRGQMQGSLVCVEVCSSQALTRPLSCAEMFAANQQTTTKLWMWRMEYLHHEQRPLYFGEWF